jgi:hypothetical protein
MSNGEEIGYGTDLHNPDTDGDGYTDGQEVYDLGSDPLDADSPTPGGADRDGDGLSNADEAAYGTDPDDGDSDDDGYGDGDEVVNGWDPLDPSSPGA